MRDYKGDTSHPPPRQASCGPQALGKGPPQGYMTHSLFLFVLMGFLTCTCTLLVKSLRVRPDAQERSAGLSEKQR